jgi:hypothetical protein
MSGSLARGTPYHRELLVPNVFAFVTMQRTGAIPLSIAHHRDNEHRFILAIAQLNRQLANVCISGVQNLAANEEFIEPILQVRHVVFGFAHYVQREMQQAQ